MKETITTASSTRVDPELLRRLRDIAQRSALEQLASGLAHRLNQPIGAITTFAQAGTRLLARREIAVGDVHTVLERIGQEALRVGADVHRIRERFEPPASALELLNFRELVGELQPLLASLASEGGGVLRIIAPPKLPPVRGDRLRLQHTLLQLVENAFESAQALPGLPIVELALGADRHWLHVAVVDNGPGVPPELQDRLFTPFVSTKPGGRGLGLAGCKSLVEAHGGEIGFDNLPGKGASFWLRLPVAVGDPDDDHREG